MARTALALFAHPDDETFGPGGTLARLAAEGVRVHLLCATRGESGTIDRSALLGRRRLARIRENELIEACRALGIESPEILNLPDGGLHRLDEETLLRPFVRAIRAHRPDVLITFHADGISGHKDHRTVTARAVTAFDRAADPTYGPHLGEPHAAARLWCYSVTESKAAEVTYRRIHSVPDTEVDAMIDVEPYLPRERAAVEAHATQKAFIEKLEGVIGDLDSFWREEAFVLAAARVPLADIARPVSDLFAGLGEPGTQISREEEVGGGAL